MKRMTLLLVPILCWALVAAGGAWADEPWEVTFYGGPSGGVYTRFATGISELLAREVPEVRVTVIPSAGSVSNLAHVSAGQPSMAIASASDIDREKRANPKPSKVPLANVMAVARLYGEYAHLVVMEQSHIKTPADLAAKRVAVGALGSGTLTTAESFFQGLGLWEKILPDYSSYDLSTRDFLTGQVHAVWQMVGYPSSSLQDISQKAAIRLLPLDTAALEAGLYDSENHYLPGTIPAGTYQGVDNDVPTFQAQAIWVVSRDLDPEFVYRALSAVFSPAGQEFLRTIHPAARQLDPSAAGRDLPLPLHPGARRFWSERQ